MRRTGLLHQLLLAVQISGVKSEPILQRGESGHLLLAH